MKTLVALFSLCVFQALSCVQEEISRSSYFNVRQSYRLVGHTIKITFAESLLMCGQFCLREPNCASFNYKVRDLGTCELNSRRKKESLLSYNEDYNFITLENEKKYFNECPRKPFTGKNCTELRNQGAPDGVYTINPDGLGNITVFCDQTTDGGGWTVFQRRVSPFNVSFNRGWVEYQQGFGDVIGEFWLGNDNIHRLTAAGLNEIRIDLTATGPQSGYAKFSGFQVASSADKYRWNMTTYAGNIGNSIYGYPLAEHNLIGRMFATTDRDNDGAPVNCARERGTGWWFGYCAYCDLNGATGLQWQSWRYRSTIIRSEMKIR